MLPKPAPDRRQRDRSHPGRIRGSPAALAPSPASGEEREEVRDDRPDLEIERAPLEREALALHDKRRTSQYQAHKQYQRKSRRLAYPARSEGTTATASTIPATNTTICFATKQASLNR